MELATKAPEFVEILSGAARSITELIGDGCVIRAPALDSGALVAVAADHRDEDRRPLFNALLDDAPLPPPGDWPGQALSRCCAVRLPELNPAALTSAGIPFHERISDVVFVPLTCRAAVIGAVRDRIPGRYSALERKEMEAIAAEATAALGAVDTSAASSEIRPDDRAHPPGHSNEVALDALAAGIWVVDARGNTVYVNEQASELVGVPANRLLGVPYTEFIDNCPPGHPADFQGEAPSDRRLIRGDGTALWVHVVARPLFDADGGRAGTTITLLDIGERHRREVELRTRLDSERALTQYAELLLREPDPSQFLPRTTQLLAEQLDLPLVALVAVCSDETEVETLSVAGGLSEIDPDKWWGKHPLSDGAATLAAVRTRSTIQVRDYEAQSTYRRSPITIKAGGRSVACVPVADGGGCLIAISPEPDAIGEEEIDVLESVARLLSARLGPVDELRPSGTPGG